MELYQIHNFHFYYVNGQLCYLSVSRKKNKDGKTPLK
jgi:hypothetical protein